MTAGIPGANQPAELHIAKTMVMANAASTLVPSVRCTYGQILHTKKFGVFAYLLQKTH